MTNFLPGLLSLVSFLFLLIDSSTAQVGIGTSSPHPSAALELNDTARGMLIPRMTASQRTGNVSPAEGLLVYQNDGVRGVWCFSSGQWINIASTNNGGKHSLVLTDGISNAQAQAKILSEAGPNTEQVRITRCSSLTTVDLSMLTSLSEVYISANPVLQSVNLSNLESVDGGILVDHNPLLANLPMPLLTRIGKGFAGSYGLQVTYSGVNTINLPMVAEILGDINIADDPNLTLVNLASLLEHPSITGTPFLIGGQQIGTLDLSSLRSVGNLNIGGGVTTLKLNSLSTANRIQLFDLNAPSLSFPSLTDVPDFSIFYDSVLQNVSFPLLTATTQLKVNSITLTSINVPSLRDWYIFDASGGNLPSSQINSLLRQFASYVPAISTRKIYLKQRIPAPPTGQGIVDKATLIQNSNDVQTD